MDPIRARRAFLRGGSTLALSATVPALQAHGAGPGGAHAHHGRHGQHGHHGGAAAACAPGTLACASAATPAFGPDGSLLLAFTAGGVVSVARSTDGGRTFLPAVPLAAPAARMDSGADARPQIVVDPRGRIVVAYAVFRDERWNADVLVATSDDGGASFTRPRRIGDNPASQRFPVLALDRSGRVFAAWIDKRNVAATRGSANPVQGASIAYAWSTDGGATFGPARIARDGSCECCRLAVAMQPGGERPALLLRAILDGGVRDHGYLAFDERSAPGALQRVADDDWVTRACPHHGPAVAVGDDGVVHAAWFTQGRRRDGLFVARSTDDGRTFSPPRPIGTADRLPARPALLALGPDTLLAWKEFDGRTTRVLAMRSRDAGAQWSEPVEVARGGGASDHPLLVAHEGRAWLSWLSQPDGYRLLPLDPA